MPKSMTSLLKLVGVTAVSAMAVLPATPANQVPHKQPNTAPGRSAPSQSRTSTLTGVSVQAAVNQVVAWTQKGGSVTVLGVREVPGQNVATADLQFNSFQYNAAGFNNEPRSKDETTPPGDPLVVYIP